MKSGGASSGDAGRQREIAVQADPPGPTSRHAAGDTPDAPKDVRMPAKGTLLVVEDNADHLELFMDAFAPEYEVISAVEVEECL